MRGKFIRGHPLLSAREAYIFVTGHGLMEFELLAKIMYSIIISRSIAYTFMLCLASRGGPHFPMRAKHYH